MTLNISNPHQARKIKSITERAPNDAVDIEFDTFGGFAICASSYTPIYDGDNSAVCPFDGVKYHARFKGTVCKVCEVCAVGAGASGFRLMV